ncbi:lactate racemase domain-containing protein [Aquisphaera insulae]|uniref:lactate racemase domain-containing protein n=1 Tax=Aquisphaera insulae TaxID=2712864 RepID=UPI0013EB3CCE|nr:lactate racemase domain-containing protein [Aquisphaera insulae]
MHVSLSFDDERLDLDIPDDKLVGSWDGPQGLDPAAAAAAAREALDSPVELPPVGRMVVAGDRVAIAWDSSLAGATPILHGLLERLTAAGVEVDDVVVVTTPGSSRSGPLDLPAGVAQEVHDPLHQDSLAYLAATKDGRRIYLNRRLTDADVVIPVGRVGYDPILGYRGPWSTLFPALSDVETHRSYRNQLVEDPADQLKPAPRWDESFEVGWLLGSQLQVGVIPGARGPAAVLAGLGDPLRGRAVEVLDKLWGYQVPSGAECVVAGIGRPGSPSGLGELVDGLMTASRLVNHGGKILALSRASGDLGPSLRRLTSIDDVRKASAILRGHDDDVDSVSGRRLARVLSWADVYLLSGLDRGTVEDLSMVPVEGPDEARRLVSRSGACLVVSGADLTRATVVESREHSEGRIL